MIREWLCKMGFRRSCPVVLPPVEIPDLDRHPEHDSVVEQARAVRKDAEQAMTRRRADLADVLADTYRRQKRGESS